MTNNPWHDIKPSDYDVHMSHPNVGQTQMLNRIIGEQLELVPDNERATAQVAILGITNGNGLEHIGSSGFQRIIGVDINQAFLDECAERYPELESRLCLYQMDLMNESNKAASVIGDCDLIIANLVIEHVHLEPFMKIVRMLPKRKRVISCVIQVNPDDSIASSSGVERVFNLVVERVEVEDEETICRAMIHCGFSLQGRKFYPLPNGKTFIRMDFA